MGNGFIVDTTQDFIKYPYEKLKDTNVEVLLSLSPDNYPFGIKDVINFGDFPVVWTNKKYRMIYLNMGHGDEVYTDATQKLLIINALKWVVSTDKKGDPFKK